MDYATARRRVGLTQPMLAERLQVGKGTVGGWETGASKPRPQMIPKLATELKISVDEVLKLTPNKKEENSL